MKAPHFLVLLALTSGMATTHASIIKFEVPLNGGNESPGPGDPDGTGFAVLTFDSVLNSVEWSVTVADIDAAVAAHIHQAPAGVSGPVRIDFAGSLVGGPIVDSDVALLLADPTSYYVNVHTSSFPAGAVRGQLAAPVSTLPEGGSGIAGFAAAFMGLVGFTLIRKHKLLA